MHDKPASESDGTFRDDWKPTRPEDPRFRCSECGSDQVWYRRWDSLCGGFEDVQYHCRSCNRRWWVESADA